jgi:hypothetical protein
VGPKTAILPAERNSQGVPFGTNPSVSTISKHRWQFQAVQ